MKISQLKAGMQSMAAVFGFAMVLTACNNSDESVNNSTTATGEKAGESNTINAASSTGSARKKAGKVSTVPMTSGNESAKIEKDQSGIYTRAEVAPSYAGGEAYLQDYILHNIEYPDEAIDNNVEGVVRVQFAVDENGNVTNVSTLGNKLGYGLEEEAMKVVAAMPRWVPGEVKGKKVKVWRTLPINYQLES